MNQKNIQLRHAVIFGSITGGAISVFLLLLYFLALLNNKTLTTVSGFIFVFMPVMLYG